MPDRPLFPVRRAHLEEMTGPLGIWQHAHGIVPDESFGVCTDDVARSLMVDLLHGRTIGWEAVSRSVRNSMAFLKAARNSTTGTFHNFRSATGAWLDDEGSQDTQGRALLGLGSAVRVVPDVALRSDARSLFEAALPAATRLTAPRAVASAILGCDAALDGGLSGPTEQAIAQLSGRLRRAFAGADLDGDWPWPEEVLTYENALLPRALIVAGRRLDDTRLRSVGLHVLDWLIEVQTTRRGSFTPIGNDGWWPKDGTRSQFDQQPIEAAALILCAATAYETTQDAGYRRAAEAAYGWFLGDNDAALPVADAARGGCHDGLGPDDVNANQGAESTLMWLTALETMRSLRTRAMVVQGGGTSRVTAVLAEIRA